MKLKVILGVLFILLILFFILGYFSSYIGYTGYDKNKLRLYSPSKKESQDRGVYIRSLNFHIDSIAIKEVFLERAYKGGEHSLDETVLLQNADSFRNNNPELPFQLIAVFNDEQGGKKVFIPHYHLLLKNATVNDTLKLEVFIRDSDHKLISKTHLSVWE